MAATSTMLAHDHLLPSSPTFVNPDLILPYSAGDKFRRTTRTPSPPPQLRSAPAPAQTVIRSISTRTTDPKPAPYRKLDLTCDSHAVAPPARSRRGRGNSEPTSRSSRSQAAMVGAAAAGRSPSYVGRRIDGLRITRLGSPPSQENIRAPNKPDRLVISAFDDEDEDDDSGHDREHDPDNANANDRARSDEDEYDLGGGDGEKTPVNHHSRTFIDATREEPLETHVEEDEEVESYDDAVAEIASDLKSKQVATMGNDERRENEDRFSQVGEESDDQFSSAALSLRAEKILANAKKRLDNMEGNLSRARSSLIMSPSPTLSPSSWATTSPPNSIRTAPTTASSSPYDSNRAAHLRRIQGSGVTPSKHRQHFQPIASLSSSSLNNSPGHSRVFSETSVPSSLYSSIQSHSREYNVARSRSVLGGSATRSLNTGTASGLSKSYSVRDNRSNRYASGVGQANGHVGERNYLSSSPYTRYSPVSPEVSHTPRLDALSEENQKQDEDEVHHDEEVHDDVSAEEYQDSPPRDEKRLSSHDFDNSTNHGLGLSRSQSTYHMRDVRDQMKDLKGRISSLQQRAREDSLRRRSLQSLRGAESPFTAAERWYLDGTNGIGDSHKHSTNLEVPRSIQGSIHNVNDDDNQSFSLESHPGPVRSHTPPRSNNDDYYPEEHSLSSPVSQSPKSDINSSPIAAPGERHEDRPDAFDYEHFYLHSRLGAYSSTSATSLSPPLSSSDGEDLLREGDREKENRYSTGSTSSVATAKAGSPVIEITHHVLDDQKSAERAATVSQKQQLRPPVHQRHSSTDSISTVATYATATEGGRWGSGGSESSLGMAIDTRTSPVHEGEPSHPSRKAPSIPSAADNEDEEGEHTPTASHAPAPWDRVAHHDKATAPKAATIPRSAPTEPDLPEDPDTDADSEQAQPTGLALEHLGDDDRGLIERVMQNIARAGGMLASLESCSEEERRACRLRLEEACRLLEEGEP